MKRFLLVVGLVFAFVAVFAVAILWSSEEREGKWQPLPNGGEIAFREVTHGVRHVIEHPPAPLLDRMQRAARYRSWRPLFEKPGKSEFSGGAEPSLGVWFTFRERSNVPTPEKAELILPDGQIFYSTSGGSSGGANRMSTAHTSFQVTPYTAEKLRFAAMFDGKRLEWEIPNPTYDPAHTAGTPEPLPQTRKAGDLEVTLYDLRLEEQTYYPTNWQVQPLCRISFQGKDASQWFSPSHQISDSRLLSAPAWRITTRLNRTNRYPFKAGEVEWTGTFSKQEADALGPEQYTLFPLNTVATDRGIKFAGIFGPGRYELREGKVVSTRPLSAVKKERFPATDWDHKTDTMKVTLKEPACVILEGRGPGVQVFRDSADQPFHLKEIWSHGSGAGRLAIHPAPAQPVRFGVAERSEPSTASQPMEFIVRPPATPAQKKITSTEPGSR